MRKILLITLLSLLLSFAFADDDPKPIPNYYSPVGIVSKGDFVRYYSDSIHYASGDADSTLLASYIPTVGFEAGKICGRDIAVILEAHGGIYLDVDESAVVYLACVIEGSVDNKTFFPLHRKLISEICYDVDKTYRAVYFDMRDLRAPYIRIKWQHSSSKNTDDGYVIYGAIRTTIIAYGGKINE